MHYPLRHVYNGWEIEAVSTVGNIHEVRCLCCHRVALLCPGPTSENVITHASDCDVAQRALRLGRFDNGVLDFEEAIAAHAKAAQAVGETTVMLENAKAELEAAASRLRGARVKGTVPL